MKNPTATLATIAAVATIALTATAFWLSYEHLHDVASMHGLADPARAWAWPATVDLFIVIGEVLILRASLAQRVDLWAIFLTVAGSAGSIGLNVAGVGADANPMNYVVAAVPPVAALLAFGAIMRQLHSALAVRVQSAPGAPAGAPRTVIPPVPVAPPPPLPERPETLAAAALMALPERSAERPESTPAYAPGAPQPAVPERSESAPEPAAKAPRKTPGKRPAKVTRGDAKEALRALYDTLGRRPVESQLVDELKRIGYAHTSRQHANKLRAEIEQADPALAALGSDNVRPLTGS